MKHFKKLLLITLVLTNSFVLASDFTNIKSIVYDIENTLSAKVGISILDVKNNVHWDYNGNTRFPLTSTFKTLACAKLLYDAEKKDLLNNKVKVNKKDLVPYSPITEKYVKKDITLSQACEATMTTSDNTAANIIVNYLGGPHKITAFIRELGDTTTRLDRMEPELNNVAENDERDTTTPNAITYTLNHLLFGNTLSLSSKEKLTIWMESNQVTGNLLRAVLPQNWRIADRAGAGAFGARSITAVVWNEKHNPFIISIYIYQTPATMEERNNAISQIGKAIFDSNILNGD